MVDNNRKLWKYILFSVLTGGIYGLYFIHKLAKDVNTICEEDGGHTAGLLKYMLLGICTLGIYPFVWQYKLANRLYKNAPRYGMSFSEDGATATKWAVFGLLLFGIGPFVSLYIIIENTNMLATGYIRGDSVKTEESTDGKKLDWQENQDIQQIPVRKKNYKWIPAVIGCIAIALLAYLSYFFAWIPQGQNLSVCIGKKLGTVKMMHHVTHSGDGNYYIGDYFLIVDPDSKEITGIGRRDPSKKKTTAKYNIHGIYFDQSEKEAKSNLESKFTSLGELGYVLKDDSDYYFTVEFTRKKVSKLSIMYWKQNEREKQWVENAREEAADGNYLDACKVYEVIQGMDVQQELEECRYQYGKELYEMQAYLDAETYLKELTLDKYAKERDECLQKISEVRDIFDLQDMQVDHLTTWYETSSTKSMAYLLFTEEGMKLHKTDENAYAIQSWEGKGDLESLNGKAEYQLKLRRLSDNRICDAELGIHSIDADFLENKYVNVSSLDIVVDEKVTNVIYNGEIVQQTKEPISKYYVNSTEYVEALEVMRKARAAARVN